MKPEKTTVAIVGSGPVGLLLAAELGMRGVSTVILGEATATSTHPKANTNGARSMEIYRRHGISTAFRAQTPSKEYRTDVAYCDRLLGHELHRVVLPSPGEAIEETRQPGTRWPTPEPQLRASQLVLEPLLLGRVQQFPSVDIRFGHRVIELIDQGDHVRLKAERQDGSQLLLEADYAVGCDGGRSFVRHAIETRLEGEGGIDLDFMGGRMLATYFHAPGLRARRRHPHAWQVWFILPHLRALMVTIDADKDLYLLHYQLPTGGTAPKNFQQVLDEVIGEPVPAEILSSADWRAGVSLVAQRFRAGRCFIAGDAAHLFTPTGGFGLNTGLEDAFNLGWKLAAVSADWAGDKLLDSYETERKPIAIRNTNYALTLARRNGECPVSADISAETPAGIAARQEAARHLATFGRWEFDTPGIQLGVSYRQSGVVIDDASPAVPDSPIDYVPTTTPGSRLPHVWLAPDEALYDRLGLGFTLISFDEDAPGWTEAASARGIPFDQLNLSDAAELKALADGNCLLVRPDQHIAWRGKAGDPGTIFDTVTGRHAAR